MSAVDLGYKPREWQKEVHLGLSNKRWGVLICHRRAGKTVLAVMQLVHRACTSKGTNEHFAYIAPFLKQAKAIAWGYLKQYTSKIPGTTINESELYVLLPNGSQIRLFGADNADALRGIYLDGLVLDEVSQLSKDLWDSILRPALADRGGWALFMGTPSGINLLSETYFAARQRDDWYSGLFTVNQTQALSPAEIDDLRRDMTPNAYAREFLCDFSAAVDNVLISVDEVEAAVKRIVQPRDIEYAPRVLGVDVARQGDDRSVAFRRQGIFADEPIIWRNLDSMAVASRVGVIINDWQPDAVFIDGSGGYGAGVIDRLRQLGYTPVEVQFGGIPDDDRFANKRSEMHFRLAEWVKREGKLPDNNELKQDLCGPTYGHDSRGRLMMEKKDDMKKRGLPSNDIGDAAALTFAFPVAARADTFNPGEGPKQVRCLTEFDPLAEMMK